MRNACLAAADQLAGAQRELARYRPPGWSVAFPDLWRACQDALASSFALREELARHAATHQPRPDSLPACAD